MLVTYSTIAALLASSAVAAPLNINLGAYSPALVVGDGEISFAAGAAGAEGLVNTLQGAAAAQGGAVAQGQAIAPAQRSAVLSEPVSLFLPFAIRVSRGPVCVLTLIRFRHPCQFQESTGS